MKLFRRLFGQQEDQTPPNHQADTASPETLATAEQIETAELLQQESPITPLNNAAPSINASVEMRMPFSVADGVTRPLPQEPALMLSGHDHLTFGQATDIGMVRTNNQDACFSFFVTSRSADERPDFGLFIVADGMGGHHDGEKASAITSHTIAQEVTNNIYLPLLSNDQEAKQTPVTESLVEAVQKANDNIIKQIPDGGTTVTVITIIGDRAYIAHVGDSRIYFITHDGIEKVTRDHSLVQRLIELDQLTPEEAAEHPQKNVLYRALGQNETLEVDTLTRRLAPNSRVLLCSDGLWNQVEDHEILEIIRRHDDPQEACEKLVALSNSRGGLDNVTTILLQIPA